MRVWVVQWIEDGFEPKVFSSRERAWEYICRYFERIGETEDESFAAIEKSYAEGNDYFCNDYIVAVERLIDDLD